MLLDPLPPTPPQVWFGSWGSGIRLRRMAAVADVWLASAYNTTPERFADARARLDGHLTAAGRSPTVFPDAIATAWLFVTEDAGEARHFLEDVLARSWDEIRVNWRRNCRWGTPYHCVKLLDDYAAVGAQRILWPLRDPIGQLDLRRSVAI